MKDSNKNIGTNSEADSEGFSGHFQIKELFVSDNSINDNSGYQPASKHSAA